MVSVETGPSVLRELLSGGSGQIGWFSLGSVPVVELARGHFDIAVIDMQHGLWERLSAHLAIEILGVPALVRPGDLAAARIGEALDCGAAGVLAPAVETAEQAHAVVAATRYPPEGIRSGGGIAALRGGFERYHQQFGSPVVGIMIETVEGVRNAEAIANVPGVDFLFLGTGNVALSIGCFPGIDPRLDEACRSVLHACQRAGRQCGIQTGSPDWACQKSAEGYAPVVIADDTGIVRRGFSAARAIVPRNG